jgi:hypothetical protein
VHQKNLKEQNSLFNRKGALMESSSGFSLFRKQFKEFSFEIMLAVNEFSATRLSPLVF